MCATSAITLLTHTMHVFIYIDTSSHDGREEEVPSSQASTPASTTTSVASSPSQPDATTQSSIPPLSRSRQDCC